MERLIDATRIEQYILNNCSDNEEINAIYAEIVNAPTIEVEPVRRGRWIFTTKAFITKDGSQFAGYKCSECGNAVWHGGNYCPNCGALMEEQE